MLEILGQKTGDLTNLQQLEINKSEIKLQNEQKNIKIEEKKPLKGILKKSKYIFNSGEKPQKKKTENKEQEKKEEIPKIPQETLVKLLSGDISQEEFCNLLFVDGYLTFFSENFK